MPISRSSMSSWMSRVGGIAKVTPRRHDEADQSTKRQPTDSSTSADAVSALPIVEPVSPIVCPASGWVSSIAPFPFQVVTTGAPSRSASATSSAEASEPMTRRRRRRSPAASRSTSSRAASSTAVHPAVAVRAPRARRGRGARRIAASAWTSIGTSSRTGPGRPVRIAFQARWRTNGSSSTRDGCHHSFTTGSKIRGLSATWRRSSSWSSPCPRM